MGAFESGTIFERIDISKQENSWKNIFGSISKREKGDVAREDKKIGDHGLITTSALIDSSAIYNPAHLLIGRDTLVGWKVDKVDKVDTVDKMDKVDNVDKAHIFQFHEHIALLYFSII